MASGPDGNIWFTHQSTAPNAIGRVTPTGTFSLFMTSTTNTGPLGIAGGPDGNVWYTKQGGIGRVTPAGMVNEYGVPNGGDSGGIVAGPDGNLWFTEPRGNKITRITPAAVFKEYPLSTAGSGPTAITSGPDGNLWFTEAAASSNKIGRITPAGVITEFAIPTPASNPGGIAKGGDGNLWFTERDAHKIGRITPVGVVTEFPTAPASQPASIAAGPDGNLWFTDGTSNAIGRVTTSGSVAEYPIPTAVSDPTGITAGPDQAVWFSELSTNKIGRISNLMGGGNVAPTNGGDTGPIAGAMCMADTDCVGSGKACGGDVCSWKVTPHVCVLASSGDPGYCTATTKCWCMGEGATCDTGAHRCSFIEHGGETDAGAP
jgi:streptogramin lyase